LEHHNHDIVIVGGGAAGLRAAIAAVELEPKLDVAIVSKVYPMRSHTVSAEGGMAAVTREYDSLDSHAYDTIKGSDFLADQDSVEFFRALHCRGSGWHRQRPRRSHATRCRRPLYSAKMSWKYVETVVWIPCAETGSSSADESCHLCEQVFLTKNGKRLESGHGARQRSAGTEKMTDRKGPLPNRCGRRLSTSRTIRIRRQANDQEVDVYRARTGNSTLPVSALWRSAACLQTAGVLGGYLRHGALWAKIGHLYEAILGFREIRYRSAAVARWNVESLSAQDSLQLRSMTR